MDLENLAMFYPHDKHCEFQYTNDRLKQLVKPTNKLAKVKGRRWKMPDNASDSKQKDPDYQVPGYQDPNNNTSAVRNRTVVNYTDHLPLQDEIISSGSEYDSSDDEPDDDRDEDYDSTGDSVSTESESSSDSDSAQSKDDFVYETDNEASANGAKCDTKFAAKTICVETPKYVSNTNQFKTKLVPKQTKYVDQAASNAKISTDQRDRTKDEKPIKGGDAFKDGEPFRENNRRSYDEADDDWAERSRMIKSKPTKDVRDEQPAQSAQPTKPTHPAQPTKSAHPAHPAQPAKSTQPDQTAAAVCAEPETDPLVERCLQNLKILENCSVDLNNHLKLMKRSYQREEEFTCDSNELRSRKLARLAH